MNDHHLHMWTGIYLYAALLPLSAGWGWLAIVTLGICRLIQQTLESVPVAHVHNDAYRATITVPHRNDVEPGRRYRGMVVHETATGLAFFWNGREYLETSNAD